MLLNMLLAICIKLLRHVMTDVSERSRPHSFNKLGFSVSAPLDFIWQVITPGNRPYSSLNHHNRIVKTIANRLYCMDYIPASGTDGKEAHLWDKYSLVVFHLSLLVQELHNNLTIKITLYKNYLYGLRW